MTENLKFNNDLVENQVQNTQNKVLEFKISKNE